MDMKTKRTINSRIMQLKIFEHIANKVNLENLSHILSSSWAEVNDK